VRPLPRPAEAGALLKIKPASRTNHTGDKVRRALSAYRPAPAIVLLIATEEQLTGHLTPLEIEVLVNDARRRAAEMAEAVRLTRSEIDVAINEGRAWRNVELAAAFRQMSKACAKLVTKFFGPRTPA